MDKAITDSLSFIFSRPAIVQVDITNHCNLDCRYCYNKSNEFLINPEMDSSKLELVIEKIIKQLNPVIVSFSGGEPFIRKDDLFKCAKMLKDANIKVYINTNGTLLNDDIINKLKALDIDQVHINIESLSGEKHDFLRGVPGAFKKTMDNLERVRQLWDPSRISISVVVNKKNLEDLLEIAKFVKEKGFGELHIIDMVPTAINDKELLLTKEEWIKFYSIYEDIKKLGIKIVPNHALLFMRNFKEDKKKPIDVPFCEAFRLKMVICADGTIVPCDYFKSKEYICGNAVTDNLLDVWQNSEVGNKFRFPLPGTYKECESCALFNKCFGGCKAFAKAINGDPFSADPYCKVYKLNEVKL